MNCYEIDVFSTFAHKKNYAFQEKIAKRGMSFRYISCKISVSFAKCLKKSCIVFANKKIQQAKK